VRIPNLIMLGLIAGAVLLIPEEVFAEKGIASAGARNEAADQSNKSGQNHRTAEALPEQAANAATPDRPDAAKDSKAEENPVDASEKSRQVRASNPVIEKPAPVDKQKHSSQDKKNSHAKQNNKNVPSKNQRVKQGEAADSIHKKPSDRKKVRVRTDEAPTPAVSSTVQVQNGDKRIDDPRNIPVNFPSHQVPDYPASKVLPAPVGQTSSHSITWSDGGSGAANAASFKASLAVLEVIKDGEKGYVYFSRMDLLRNQWVNAPPAPPPEQAL
jgi:hypothetical protein